MKPVVWVGTNLAWPPRTGATLRSHRLVRALAERTEVHVVAVGHGLDAEGFRDSTGAASVVAFPERVEGARARLFAVRRGWPLRVARPWSGAAEAHVRSMSEGAVVVVDHVDALAYRPDAGPWVLSTHNAEAALLADAPTPPGWRGVEARREARALRALESAAVRDPRCAVVVVSAEDAQLLAAPVAVVVPNGTDLPDEAPQVPRDGTVLLVGSLDYAPNAEGVAWWAREVSPHTDAVLTVVGRHPEAAAGLVAVRAVGEVADVGPWLAEASVVAVPLLSGGGTRLKVLEALAWGRPVVSTTKGAEGLGLRDGVHLLLRDDPAAFAAAVEQLRGDPVLAAELGAAGRSAAQAFAWPSAGRSLVELVAGL